VNVLFLSNIVCAWDLPRPSCGVVAVDGERRAIMGEFDGFGSEPTAGAHKVCEVAFELHTARRCPDHQSFMLASSCLGVT
jgi:hypothetical protein